jgi:hypothetical protein
MESDGDEFIAEVRARRALSSIHEGHDDHRAAEVSREVEAAVRARLGSGEGILKVARTLGVGVSVVQRVQRESSAMAGGLPLAPDLRQSRAGGDIQQG